MKNYGIWTFCNLNNKLTCFFRPWKTSLNFNKLQFVKSLYFRSGYKIQPLELLEQKIPFFLRVLRLLLKSSTRF